jgi:hypothetical protein
MSVVFAENTTGIWVTRQTNASCSNGIYRWRYMQEVGYLITYYWRVTVTDGYGGIDVKIYHFTSADNSPPTISSPSPSNGSTDIALQTWCGITIFDPDGDTMTITWYENSTGSYILRQTDSSVPGGAYQFHLTQATILLSTYYWRVNVTDGYGGNVSAIYHFNTTGPSFTSSISELTITFTDTTPATDIIAWLWDFGDNTSSTEQNPTHDYPAVGIYNVTLIITQFGGFNSSVTHPIITTQITQFDRQISRMMCIIFFLIFLIILLLVLRMIWKTRKNWDIQRK